jgi:predicted aldo/keto reductase-like oxidoreductase
MLGPALEPYRNDCFLACKTHRRDAEEARKELEQSLRKLRTDYFDLYQLHAMTRLEDVDKVMAPGGVMDVFLQAREQGKVRYLGFSAHSVEAAMALMDRFDFDSILFPVNYATWHAGNFGPQVLARAQEKGMCILALKAMAKTRYPKDTPREDKLPKMWYVPLEGEAAEQGLRFTLSHPVTAAIPPGNEDLFFQAVDYAPRFQPLDPAEALAMKTQGMETEPLFQYPQV